MANKGSDVPGKVARLANEKHPSTISPVKLFDVKQARAALAYAYNLAPGNLDVEDNDLAEFLTNLGANIFASAGVRAVASNVGSLVTIVDKTRLVPSDKVHHVLTRHEYLHKPSVPSHVVTQSRAVPEEHRKSPYNRLQIELLAAKRENVKNMKCNSRIVSRMRALSRIQTRPHFSQPLQKEKQFIIESMMARKQLGYHLLEMKATVKIVVVGAGLAGLSAAHQLISFGFRKVIVLEALDRVGGRIHSVPYSGQSKRFLEMGVESVDHAKDDNSVYSLVRQYGLNQQMLVENRMESIIMFANGALMQTDLLNYLSLPSDVIHSDIHLINSQVKSSLHRNIKLSFDDYVKERHRRIIQGKINLSSNQHAQASKIVNRLAFTSKYQLGHTHGALAVHLLGSNEDRERHVMLPSGMTSLLDPLMSNFKAKTVRLKTCVNRIEWQLSPSLNNSEVKITCSDGRFFRANHVIVAVPLGHLKENADKMFLPTLPVEKMAAINKVCFGTIGKIYLIYEKPFWSQPFNFTWLGTESDIDKIWPQTLTFKTLNAHPNVIEVCILGNAAETMPNLDVMRQLCSILSIYFGIKIPLPVDTRITKWGSNPMFRGTHPFLSTECSEKEQRLLEQPLKNGDIPEVLFAGDYTFGDYSCLLHAARASGLREANRIHNFYNAHYCLENINP